MPELLIEFLSEEIPARMQAGAARDLARLAQERLGATGLTWGRLRSFAGPRRLTLVIDDLPVAQPDRCDVRKGPKIGAPEAALAGFLRSTGLARADLVERDGVYFGEIATRGRATRELVAELVPAIAQGFPWPKSMRSGVSAFRWVRPLKSVVCLFDGAVVDFTIDAVASGRATRGHRFMGAAPGESFAVRDFADYVAQLADRYVVVDATARRARIEAQAQALCAAAGLELVADAGLLDEVTGLAEWPTPVLGPMDARFLDLPPEVIRTSMRTHQKYFAVRRAGGTGLAPHFVVVANVEARDGGASLAAGNARVLSARLEDARFFWNEDLKPGSLDRWRSKLGGVTFHAKLGDMASRVDRITRLAARVAVLIGAAADAPLVASAALDCKSDLASLMVGEFPELQGVMGGYYARLQPDPGFVVLYGEAGAGRVADAIRDHYKPVGPSDEVPRDPVTVAVALADKLDTLIGFFSIDEKPTGSRDPYALRRAALGVIRLVRENGLRVRLRELFPTVQRDELLAFFIDRLKVQLRDEGVRHDLVDAVVALGDDDIIRIVARVGELQSFLSHDDGANLLAGYRRAANILKAEARKHPDERIEGPADPASFVEEAERLLAQGLQTRLSDLDIALQHENFGRAMASLARLRDPVDAFFDRVLVNDPDPAVRLNRLRLLSTLRAAADHVADFSLISG